jgi:hypothetical protein
LISYFGESSMRYPCHFVVFSGILALYPLWVGAQNAETIADIRCLAVGIKVTEQNNSSQQSAGTMLTLYYIGRLEGRISKLDIENLLSSEIRNMASVEYAAEAKRCAASLAEAGQQIARIGEAVSKLGQ